ncbi:hypothetical protein J4437_06405 [Candidatus Woesearchaeota archaeon]|nr:hypothetical protein [Candidatus Woesearchaeota archaeon]
MATLGWRDQRKKMLNLAKSSHSYEKNYIQNNERNMKLLNKLKEMRLNKQKRDNEKKKD